MIKHQERKRKGKIQTLPRVYARAAPATPAPTTITSVFLSISGRDKIPLWETLTNPLVFTSIEALLLFFPPKANKKTNPRREAKRPPNKYRSKSIFFFWVFLLWCNLTPLYCLWLSLKGCLCFPFWVVCVVRLHVQSKTKMAGFYRGRDHQEEGFFGNFLLFFIINFFGGEINIIS